MTRVKPQLFERLDVYTRIREMRASTMVFENYGWYKYEEGHTKLFGTLLWHYEGYKQTRFKYSKVLKKLGYQRTHNYRLLKLMVEKGILKKEGGGYYGFTLSVIQLIEKVLCSIRQQDMMRNKKEADKDRETLHHRPGL
jgi:hypothetical protein